MALHVLEKLAPEKGRIHTFRALQYRNFRILWLSLIVSFTGIWMQNVAQSLLVLHLTHGSATALGAVALVQALAFFLFALVGGSIADRIDKRRLLLITQSLSLFLAMLLGLLTVTGVIQVWMIMVLAFFSGTVLSFDQPTRSSLIPMLVPQQDLMNAISLQSMIFNSAAVFGPILAGIAIGFIGYAGNFFLNGLSFLAVLFAISQLHIPKEVAEAGTEKRGPLLTSIYTSLKTVRQDEVLPWILSAYGALLFFGPSATLILPVFATQILHLNAFQVGMLFASMGLGTVIGALFIASLGDFRYKGALLLVSLLIWASGLFVFALCSIFWLSLGALLISSLAQNGVASTTITIMQMRVPQKMRGRMMSLNTLLLMGMRPLGDFPAGVLISLVGGPLTVMVSTVIVGIYALYLLVAHPALRSV